MTSWGWRPERTDGIWHHGTTALRPLIAAAPWITVAFLVLLMSLVSGRLVATHGILFDLPKTELTESATTGPVALLMPFQRETLVFFDDSRYILGDDASLAALAEHFNETAGRMEGSTLLALADRRVSAGDLMKFTALARSGGIQKVLFAEQKEDAEE